MATKSDAADLANEIDALRRMTVTELRRRHAELFGEETRAGNRQYLFRRIAWRVQALAEGDLTQRAQRRARELARDADLRRRPPRELTMPPAPADLKTLAGQVAVARDDRLPKPGQTLTRPYKGHMYEVKVLPNGFEYDGRAYRSLSAIAHAITGSHWNGYRFFSDAKPQARGAGDNDR